MTTWDEFERQRAYHRPADWQERPDGPDQWDVIVADMNAAGLPITREALHPEPCDYCARHAVTQHEA